VLLYDVSNQNMMRMEGITFVQSWHYEIFV
jgi:hypothetical protein